MTRVVVPDPVMVPPPPVADNRPLVSVSVTVKVSPAVFPVSEMLTPEIASGLPTPTVGVLGAAITGEADPKSAVWGKGVDLGGRRIIIKKNVSAAVLWC